MDPELIERLRRDTAVPWDELREQRLLGQVLARRKLVIGRRSQLRRQVVWMAAASVLLALPVGAWLHGRGARSSPMVATTWHRPWSLPSVPDELGPSRMVLWEGAEATLLAQADVQLLERRPEATIVRQSAGMVRYRVSNEAGPLLVVRVHHVEVEVRGAVVHIGVDVERTQVTVEQGRAEVVAFGLRRSLVTGETYQTTTRAAAPRGDRGSPATGPTTSSSSGPSRASSLRPASPDSADDLWRSIDDARQHARWDEAASLLRRFLAAQTSDPRVPSALFTLGRVEERRGHPAEAARRFGECQRRAPSGPLAEDALAAEAVAWKDAGDAGRATDAARRYLQLHPRGVHAAHLRSIAP